MTFWILFLFFSFYEYEIMSQYKGGFEFYLIIQMNRGACSSPVPTIIYFHCPQVGPDKNLIILKL